MSNHAAVISKLEKAQIQLQFAILKRFVALIPTIAVFTQKALFYLLDQSDCLQANVFLVFPPELETLTIKTRFEVHDILSGNSNIQLGRLVKLLRLEMEFSDYGLDRIVDNAGQRTISLWEPHFILKDIKLTRPNKIIVLDPEVMTIIGSISLD